MCPLLAFQGLYFTYDYGLNEGNSSKTFPGDGEVVLQLVEEVMCNDTVGTLYATQYRVVYCPYEPLYPEVYVRAFSLWYGSIDSINSNYVTNVKKSSTHTTCKTVGDNGP